MTAVLNVDSNKLDLLGGMKCLRFGKLHKKHLNCCYQKMEKERLSVTSQGASRLLERMGYVPHPALENGWTPNTVPPFNKKAKLYIHHTSPHCHHNFQPPEVVRLFTHAQETALDFVPVFGSTNLPGMMQ